MEKRPSRAELLIPWGASPAETEEILQYGEQVFECGDISLPLPDEPFVATWQEYEAEASTRGAFTVLREKLPQWQFPIESGISETPAYRDATRRGIVPKDPGPDIGLRAPESITLDLHRTAAGRIPILTTHRREDFESVVRALLYRNEPAPLPASVGAYMVAGYNNWDRVLAWKNRWHAEHPEGTQDEWQLQFRALADHKERYQDRFIILSDGPYSNIEASALGLATDEWQGLSLVIRREHECAHYFTRRVFGFMRDHLLDELLADFAGLVAACGKFRASWFLRFMGLENPTQIRGSGRLNAYRGEPPLSVGAFGVLQKLLSEAARNLEKFTADERFRSDGLHFSSALIAIAGLSLEELASSAGHEWLMTAFQKRGNRIG